MDNFCFYHKNSLSALRWIFSGGLKEMETRQLLQIHVGLTINNLLRVTRVVLYCAVRTSRWFTVSPVMDQENVRAWKI